MEEFAVILVESTSQAMRLENLLHISGVQSKLIPVPRFLSSACGNCLKLELSNLEAAQKVIDQNKIPNATIEIVQM